MKSVAFVLACAFCLNAVAAPPPAPVVTVQATDIRQLEFDYSPVTQVNWYELWFRADPGAQWVKYQHRAAQRGPMFRIAVPVHLIDWRSARYHVKACNPSGCTASNEVGIDGEQLVAMGFIKPAAASGHRYFGGNVALSADGKTAAVLASEQIGGQQDSVTVHVYRMTTGTSGWRREARLLPGIVQSGTAQPFAGDPIALSGDGNLLVLGVPAESGAGTNGSRERGAVYLYRRSGSAWQFSQKLVGADLEGDRFGFAVKIDDAGRTLVVTHNQAIGNRRPGTLEIYRDPEDASDQFMHVGTRDVPYGNEVDSWCDGVALSGDGLTLVRGCGTTAFPARTLYVYNGPDFTQGAALSAGRAEGGIDLTFDGKVILYQEDYYASIYRLTATGWVSDGWLPPVTGPGPNSRRHIAISRDGQFAVYGSSVEYTVGVGPVYPPYQAGDEADGSGGVAVYQRKASGWVLRRLVKPGSAHAAWAGHSVALGDNGRVLIVGAPMDPSAAIGIDGDRDDASMPERGAVWIY